MEFKSVLKVVIPYVDGYCAWAKRYQPYDYVRGAKKHLLKTALLELSEYFTDVRPPANGYICNDGHQSGGGFTGPVCSYGTMPCYMTFRFHDHLLEVTVSKARNEQGSAVPGLKLFCIMVANDNTVIKEGWFENILK